MTEPAVAAAPRSAESADCLVPATAVTPALRADVQRRAGVVPGWLARIAPVPWIAHTLCDAMTKPGAYAPAHLCDLVALVVSQDNSCRYCYGAQRSVLKIQGYGDEYLDRLLRDFHTADLSPAERSALDFARHLSRSNPRPGPDEFATVVRAGLERTAVVEVVAVAAIASFTNRVSTLLALPPEADLEGLVNQRLFRFVRPFVAWRMRSGRRPPESSPVPNEGLAARVVAALGTSPFAGIVRRALDGALASPILPRRTKGLMLAVIARALGCAHGEAECRQLLAAEGLGAELDGILATLTSPALDHRERRLVPFARETVRYQPAVIQRRIREVCAGFTPEETLESVGFLALGNALCRLSVVLDAC